MLDCPVSLVTVVLQEAPAPKALMVSQELQVPRVLLVKMGQPEIRELQEQQVVLVNQEHKETGVDKATLGHQEPLELPEMMAPRALMVHEV